MQRVGYPDWLGLVRSIQVVQALAPLGIGETMTTYEPTSAPDVRCSHSRSHLLVVGALGAGQHDPAPQRQRLG